MSSRRQFLWGLGLAIGTIVLLLHYLGNILAPFALAMLLAFLANPTVDWMCRHHFPRTLATILSFLVIFLIGTGLVLLVIPIIEQEGVELARALANYLPLWNTTAIPWIRSHLGLDVSSFSHLILSLKLHLHSLPGLTGPIFDWISRSGVFLVGLMFDLFLVPILTFYLLRDWNRLLLKAPKLAPPAYRQQLIETAREVNHVLSAFFRGQILVMVALAVSYTLGLTLVGLHVALLVGCFAGLMSFVPYLGFFSGLLVACIAMVIQGGGGIGLLAVLAVFAIGEGLESFVYIPWLIGGRTHLHPVTVIFAILAGGTLFGFVGVLLAVPVAAVGQVVLRLVLAQVYTDPLSETPLLPPSRSK
jgi:predicted PurR-regulated permease PerM